MAPTKNNEIDLFSPYMETELYDMDIELFHMARDSYVAHHKGRGKYTIVNGYAGNVSYCLFPRNREEADIFQRITDRQITVITELMTFYLDECDTSDNQRCEDNVSVLCRSTCIGLLLELIVVLLTSNKKHECKTWMREHLSELKSLRDYSGASILHLALIIPIDDYSRVPIVRELVEECKMDVNVENNNRQTPLRLLSLKVLYHKFGQKHSIPLEDMRSIAELFINNGAHMDAVDVYGKEASYLLDHLFPEWSFNFSLKCLAARAILKHGVKYETNERVVPEALVKFIKSHKPGSL